MISLVMFLMVFGQIFRRGYFQNADTQCVDWRLRGNRKQKDIYDCEPRLEEMISFA